MIYKPFGDMQLSQLGMGNMRLPTVGGGNPFTAPVDEEKAHEIIRYVYEQGVNYFDTAFLYHNGASEVVLGRALAEYPRDSFYIADKFWYQSMTPGMTIPEFFEIQLERCGVEYFDFYLIHNISDDTIEDYLELDRTQNMLAYFEAEKARGRIKHLGFSCHAGPENLERFLDYHDFEFVQIQCNYLDWTLQNAKRKYEILTGRGLPVIIMEPVRGGRLADLGPEDNAKLKTSRPDDSVASWAFRWLQGLDNVCVILSGMSTLEQAQDNVKTFQKLEPLNEAETELIGGIVGGMLENVPCTACRYCHDCPRKLDIPTLIDLYNTGRFEPFEVIPQLAALPEEQQPQACIACGVCKKACPQGIDIPDVLEKLAAIPKAMAG